MSACHSRFGVPGIRTQQGASRGFVAAVVTLSLAIFNASGDSVPGQDVKPLAAPPNAELGPLESRPESKLMARTNLSVVNVPLTLAVKKLSETHGIPIKLDNKALAAAGVALDAPVTTTIKNYTLRAALCHLLGNADLAFDVTDDVLAVSVAPPEAPQAEPPGFVHRRPAPAPRNAAVQPAFMVAMVQMRNAPAAIAQFNGVRIVCMPVQDQEAAEARRALDGDEPPPKMQVTIQGGQRNIEQLIFSQDRSAVAARERLLERLEHEIDAVDRICDLTNVQNEKLRLAGRGDVKRLLDRVDAIGTRIGDVSEIGDLNDFVKWANELSVETEALQPVLATGPFDGNSLFVKALKTTLTPEQAAKHARACVKAR